MSSKRADTSKPRPSDHGRANGKKHPSTAGSQKEQQSQDRGGSTWLGKFELKKKLGSGGMGAVYLAHDTKANRNVALKVLPRSRAQNPTLVKRFQAEALAAADLNSPHIVDVYEAGQIDDYLYIALEYVPGTDLHHLISKRGPLPISRSLDIVRQVARALEHAYGRNIVHRDIKPSNLLITRDGTVKLADLGLARRLDEDADAGITRAGTTVGTVDYMAPEQARSSKSADVRSDIYSLGCTWYQMLTGEPPFPKGSLTNKLHAHVTEPRPDPRAKNPDIPEGLVVVLHRMMDRNPKQRYQTPTELLEDLQKVGTRPDQTADEFVSVLADEIASDQKNRDTGPPSPAALKLPKRRRPANERPRREGLSLDAYKLMMNVVIGAIVLLAIVLGGWAINSLSDTFDAPKTVPDQAPFEEPAPPAQAKADPKPPQPPADASPPVQEPSIQVERSPGQSVDASYAEKIRFGKPDEKAQMPAWVTTAWGEVDAKSPATTLTVGRRGEEAPAQFATLEEALGAVPAEGAVVQLQSEGPFVLPPTQISGPAEFVIAAAPGVRPLIRLATEQEGAILQIAAGSLTLSGVDLLIAAGDAAGSLPVTAIEVRDGNLTVRDCSVTLQSGHSVPATAFSIARTTPAAAGAGPSRVLLESVFCRGENLTALAIFDESTDLVASNCLLLSGAAPAVRYTSGESASEAGQTTPSKALRFFSSTVVSDRTAFEFAARSQSPAPQRVLTMNCAIGTRRGGGDSVLASLVDWPQSMTGVTGLGWKVRTSVFAGWPNLVRSDPDGAILAAGSSNWDRVWNEPSQLLSVDPIARLGRAVDDFAAATPQTLGTAGLGPTEVGCDVASLHHPQPGLLERAEAFAVRLVNPLEAGGLSEPAETVTITLDATTDLAREINESTGTSTRYVVTGEGEHACSPIRIDGRSIEIVVEPTAGASLVLKPRDVVQWDGADPVEGAFIAVTDGSVSLEGLAVEMPRNRRNAGYGSFLYVSNGSFSLRRCSVYAPMVKAPPYEALVCWEGEGDPGVAMAGEISDCFLFSDSKLITAEVSGRQLQMRNSVLGCVDDLLSLDLSGDGAVVAIDHCTLTTAETFVALRGGLPVDRTPQPSRFLVRNSVFIPATFAEHAAATLVSGTATLLDPQRTQWWSQASAYSPKIATPIVTEGSSAAPQAEIEAALSQHWGASHVGRILAASDVLFEKPRLDGPANVTVSDFRLEPNSRAVTWTTTGSAVGADVEALATAFPTDSGKPEPKNGKSPKPARKQKLGF